MAMSTARFNFVQPGLEPAEMSDRYRAALDMVSLMDAKGFAMVSLEEHHGAENGWSPSPLATAGLIFGRSPDHRCHHLRAARAAARPVAHAEDIAVLDLASGGRLIFVAGIGYRPRSSPPIGRTGAARGRLMDESLDTMLKAWTGEPFEFRGRRCG